MHTIPELGTTVPAFLAKLWKLVENPENDDLICWAPNGRSFFIRNQARFARELLPHYYKHNNMASFVRQLNMYGFHKKVSVELGGLKCDKDEMEFAHQYFCRGHPYLVEHIKRKIASNKGQDPAHAPIKPELMNKMLTEVRSMRGRQEHLDSKLGAMKRENEALWRELAMLRQKHLKQQQIVNKLIHFLVTLVQPSRNSGLSVKRRYPLMIDDSNRQRKQSKMSKAHASPTGPVIHELDSDPDLDSQYIVAEMLENHQSPNVESPEHEPASFADDDDMSTIQLVDDSTRQLREEIQEIDSRKKRSGHKGKKKRKNKVPIKILIPAMENGEEPREETHLLEMPLDEDESVTIALLENEPIPKPVPIATVRSSKLAAMAANMNKNRETQDQSIDLDSSVDLEEDREDPKSNDNQSLIKLEDILIIPEIINEEHIQEHNNQNNESEQNIDNNNTTEVEQSSKSNRTESNKSTKETEKNTSNGTASTSSSLKDLSLSCVNPSGISDASYRLGSSTEDVDNHLETMQTELDNLREILRGEGYSIDANTLLGLFGSDDPMSFGVPVNPELDPHSSNNDKDEEEHNVATESVNGSGEDNGSGGGSGGEIMTYNSTQGLLDFDDIFLGATPSSSMSPSMTTTTNDFNTNSLGSSDPLDLEDSKNSLLDSLVSDSLVK